MIKSNGLYMCSVKSKKSVKFFFSIMTHCLSA